MNKDKWHLKYKKYVLIHFKYRCSMCNKHTEVNEGCVHHKTYIHDGGIYNADASELILLDKITWVCYDCHNYIHSNQSIDNITAIRRDENEYHYGYSQVKTKCIYCGLICDIEAFYDETTCYDCYHRNECENENID